MAALRDRRHEKVAQLLATMKTPEEASREAGYRDGTSFIDNARKRANRPDIKKRVAELQAREADLVSIDVAWIKRKTSKIAGVEFESEEVRPSDALAALNLLAKMTEGALVPQKTETTGPDGGPVQIQTITRTIVEPQHPDSEDIPPTT
jgi:hypothetical protein